MDIKLFPQRRPFIFKLAAIVTVITFSLPFPLHAQFIAPAQETAEHASIGLYNVTVPDELGTVQEIYESSSQAPAVILIQDAHAIPDAQRSIQGLIDFFQQKHGVKFVALEGASSDLDSQIFKSFPDQELLKKVLNEYSERGELAGTTAAAIFNPSSSVYRGIEDWDLYEEGLRYFLDAMEGEAKIKAELGKLSEDLEKQKAKIYSKDLLEVDRTLKDFRKDKLNILEVLENLASVQAPEKGSELAVLWEEIARKNENKNSIEMEVKKMAGRIKAKLAMQKTPALSHALRAFNQEYQQFQTSRISPEAFALFLENFSAQYRISVRFSKRLKRLMRNQKRMRDIQGTKLFEELEKYSRWVKESLFRNDGERKLDIANHKLELMERLASLELSREDWDEIKQDTFFQNIWPHLNFYHNAEKREEAMFKNLMRKGNKSILIAGGFHTQGIIQRLKAQGNSYVLIMPKINHLPDESHYRDQMKGQVSWAKYFEVRNGKVNLYNAFVRGTRDKLLSTVIARSDPLRGQYKARATKQSRGKILKTWRDEIIRDLAKTGGLAKSGQYTRFMDEAAPENKNDAFMNQWEANINRFIEGLRHLKSENQITEENILKLFQPAAIPAGVAAAPTAKSELRADLIPQMRLRLAGAPKRRSEARNEKLARKISDVYQKVVGAAKDNSAAYKTQFKRMMGFKLEKIEDVSVVIFARTEFESMWVTSDAFAAMNKRGEAQIFIREEYAEQLTDDELAYIIGHEFGHTQQLIQTAKNEGAAVSVQPPQVIFKNRVSYEGGDSTILLEDHADLSALSLMDKAGFEPSAALSAVRKTSRFEDEEHSSEGHRESSDWKEFIKNFIKEKLKRDVIDPERDEQQQKFSRSEVRKILNQVREIGGGDFGIMQDSMQSAAVKLPVIRHDQDLTSNRVTELDMTSPLTDRKIAGPTEGLNQLTAGNARELHRQGDFLLNGKINDVTALTGTNITGIGRQKKPNGLANVPKGFTTGPPLGPTAPEGGDRRNNIAITTAFQNDFKSHSLSPLANDTGRQIAGQSAFSSLPFSPRSEVRVPAKEESGSMARITESMLEHLGRQIEGVEFLSEAEIKASECYS